MVSADGDMDGENQILLIISVLIRVTALGNILEGLLLAHTDTSWCHIVGQKAVLEAPPRRRSTSAFACLSYSKV